MARRRRKGKGRRGKSALPLAQAMIIGVPLVTPLLGGVNVTNANQALWNLTGIDAVQHKWTQPMNGVRMGVMLVLASTVGRKVANRVGVNRMIRKASGNLVQLF